MLGLMADSWWQSWLVPDRPGLRQFVIVAFALLAPVPAVLLGPEMVLPALAAGLTVGLGFGIGWAFLYGGTWFRQSPLNTIAIFACAAACLLHLEVLPRWDVILRVGPARDEFTRFTVDYATNQGTPLPHYQRGPEQQRAEPGPTERVLIWTALPLRRWTLTGWQDRVWIVAPKKGEVVIIWNRQDLEAYLDRAPTPTPTAPALDESLLQPTDTQASSDSTP